MPTLRHTEGKYLACDPRARTRHNRTPESMFSTSVPGVCACVCEKRDVSEGMCTCEPLVHRVNLNKCRFPSRSPGWLCTLGLFWFPSLAFFGSGSVSALIWLGRHLLLGSPRRLRHRRSSRQRLTLPSRPAFPRPSSPVSLKCRLPGYGLTHPASVVGEEGKRKKYGN